MRVAGQVGVAGLVCACSQGGLEAADQGGDLQEFPLGPEPYVGRDLVVAAPTRVEPCAGGACQLCDPPLNGSVNVLVGGREVERTVGQLGLGGVQR